MELVGGRKADGGGAGGAAKKEKPAAKPPPVEEPPPKPAGPSKKGPPAKVSPGIQMVKSHSHGGEVRSLSGVIQWCDLLTKWGGTTG